MSGMLTNAEIAAHYTAARTVQPDPDVVELSDKVDSWLAQSGLEHRRSDAFTIAIEIAKLASPRMPTPQQAAFEVNQAEGISDQQPLTAEYVAGLDMRGYAELRQRLGIGRSQSAGVLGPVQ